MAATHRLEASTSDEQIAAQLRAVGLRRTEPRVAVLRHLASVGHPVTHAEVAAALAKRGLDRVSVYRVLVDLARVKVLTRTDAGDHVWRFALRRGDRSHYREHPHFVCVNCGSVACMPDKAVKLAAVGKAPRSIRARRVEVQVKGECDACAAV